MPEGEPGTTFRYDGSRAPFTSIGISQLPMLEGAESEESEPDYERRSYYVERTVDYVPEARPDESPLNDEEWKLARLVALRDLLVEVRLRAAESIQARLEAAAAARDGLADEADVNKKMADADQAQATFDRLWLEAIKTIRRPGLMVVRTNTRKRISLAARVSSVFGLNAASDEEYSGFAIFAGLHTSQLYLGDDLERWAEPPGTDWYLIGTRFPFILDYRFPFIGQYAHTDVQVLTAKLSADYVLYAADKLSEKQIQTKLEATVEQLSDLSTALTEADKVSIEGVLTAVESLGNIGVLGQTTERIVEIGSEGPMAEGKTVSRTVYEVLTDYDDLERLSRSWPRLHFSRWL